MNWDWIISSYHQVMVHGSDIVLLMLQLGDSNEHQVHSVQEVGQGVGIFVQTGVELVVVSALVV